MYQLAPTSINLILANYPANAAETRTYEPASRHDFDSLRVPTSTSFSFSRLFRAASFQCTTPAALFGDIFLGERVVHAFTPTRIYDMSVLKDQARSRARTHVCTSTWSFTAGVSTLCENVDGLVRGLSLFDFTRQHACWCADVCSDLSSRSTVTQLLSFDVL